MMQARGVEFLVEQHRQELMGQAGARQLHRATPAPSQDSATQRSAAGIPVTGGRAVRRAVAPRVGTWLIAFGTRLGGGATMRTSS
jgi:hypothetical protein